MRIHLKTALVGFLFICLIVTQGIEQASAELLSTGFHSETTLYMSFQQSLGLAHIREVRRFTPKEHSMDVHHKEQVTTGLDLEELEIHDGKIKVGRFHISIETLRDVIQNPAKLVALDMTMNSAKGLYDTFNSYQATREQNGSPLSPCQEIRIHPSGSTQDYYVYDSDKCSDSKL